MSGISQNASDVRAIQRQGIVGELAFLAPSDETITLLNKAGQAAQVGTIVVDTATNSATYAWLLNNVAQTYVADSSTSTAEVATGIADVINADPLTRGQVSAEASSATVTITGTWPGVAFTLSDSDAKITSTEATTAAASASEVPFGRLLISQGFSATGLSQYGALPLASRLSAQVDSWAITYDAAVLMHAAITIDGQTYSSSVTMATDAATSVTALVAALNLVLPSDSVLASASTASLVLTAEVPGKAFVSAVWFGVGRDTGAAVLTQTAPVSSDINRAAAGVSLRATNTALVSDSATEAKYQPNDAMRAARKASGVWVTCAQTITPGDPVYVETASGSDTGKFFNTSTATRIRLNKARWLQDEATSNSQSIAIVAVDLGSF